MRAWVTAATIESPDKAGENEVLERLSHDFELCAYGLGEVRREWERRDAGRGATGTDSPQVRSPPRRWSALDERSGSAYLQNIGDVAQPGIAQLRALQGQNEEVHLDLPSSE